MYLHGKAKARLNVPSNLTTLSYNQGQISYSLLEPGWIKIINSHYYYCLQATKRNLILKRLFSLYKNEQSTAINKYNVIEKNMTIFRHESEWDICGRRDGVLFLDPLILQLVQLSLTGFAGSQVSLIILLYYGARGHPTGAPELRATRTRQTNRSFTGTWRCAVYELPFIEPPLGRRLVRPDFLKNVPRAILHHDLLHF